jgi:hypothetical protein
MHANVVDHALCALVARGVHRTPSDSPSGYGTHQSGDADPTVT